MKSYKIFATTEVALGINIKNVQYRKIKPGKICLMVRGQKLKPWLKD